MVKARWKESGCLGSNVQVRLQGSKYELIPLLQPNDIADLKEYYVKHPFEYVNLPCTQTGKDLQTFRMMLGNELSSVQIVAKIDTTEALHQFDNILPSCDAVNIIREDLALELEPEKLLLAQKWITQKAIAAAKPVFLQS